MEVQRVQIEQQMARIKIESQRAHLKIEQEMRKLEIESQRAKMTVDFEPGKVELDATSLRNNTARKDIYTLQDQFAANAKSLAEQGVRTMVSDAEFMAQLPNKSGMNKVGQLHMQKMLDASPPPPALGRSTMPQPGVSMSGSRGEFTINWEPYTLDISWGAHNGPTITVEPKAQVNVELAQRASVECTVVEMTIPKDIGNIIDTSV